MTAPIRPAAIGASRSAAAQAQRLTKTRHVCYKARRQSEVRGTQAHLPGLRVVRKAWRDLDSSNGVIGGCSLELEGKRVIVTGGASGIGESAVRRFVREGARVAAFDVQDDRGQEVVKAVNSEGPGRAMFCHCDQRFSHDVDRAFVEASNYLAGLDALVNCAGMDKITPAESITEDEWDLVVGVHLKGTFLTNRAAFPHLSSHGGRIINFASSAALMMFPGHASYVASKAAVVAWSRSVAAEWGLYGINVNSFLPFARTPMNDKFQASLTQEQNAAFEAHVAALPLGRMGDPDEDIAPVLVFLLSDASATSLVR
jgi:NAD(P)-dependent dehydrogenase (short-subunit alcohol dehydrogenase family)